MKKKALAAAAAVAIFGAAILLDSRYNLDVTEYELCFASLPTDFDGYRIALVSDLHGWSFGKENQRLIDKIRHAQPDLIAITGDMVSAAEDFEAVEDLLDGISGLAPIYYVNGNHEWGGRWTAKIEHLMESHGVKCLSNEFEPITRGEGRIIICGAEDRKGPADMIRPPELAEKLRSQYPEDFVLWLNHRNDMLIYYPSLPVELVLSGHAHGGIIRLPGLGGILDVRGKLGAEYEKGIYNEGTFTQLVSRGLGNSVFIPRFLNRPELPVISLRSSEISFL